MLGGFLLEAYPGFNQESSRKIQETPVSSWPNEVGCLRDGEATNQIQSGRTQSRKAMAPDGQVSWSNLTRPSIRTWIWPHLWTTISIHMTELPELLELWQMQIQRN
ncbi:hypothetical protein KC19_VG154100 [Ceratodon purpureus]|uniref:Uncharacterized protein n=1 Tax=Ceratodon purpureus TaxID=3225 RepID=A0A8T0HRJ5_CERPU|nr:hypothetical protein KC19_VG154100 [Ceratodon purpureus]